MRGIEIVPGDIDVNVGDARLAGKPFDDVPVTPVEELDGWVPKRIGRALCGAMIARVESIRAHAGHVNGVGL